MMEADEEMQNRLLQMWQAAHTVTESTKTKLRQVLQEYLGPEPDDVKWLRNGNELLRIARETHANSKSIPSFIKSFRDMLAKGVGDIDRYVK